MSKIDRKLLQNKIQEELRDFKKKHPRSLDLFEKSKAYFLNGVPMNWMTRWAGEFPLYIQEAKGAHFTDVDGNNFIDFCLGDTGAMAGHAPDAAVEAITKQAAMGNTFMLPTEDSLRVGEELTKRFGLPYWQTALTATDANRFAIRWARQITRRPKNIGF
jgi:glutamate-1-semialdehyde 2,1-aminomutase